MDTNNKVPASYVVDPVTLAVAARKYWMESGGIELWRKHSAEHMTPDQQRFMNFVEKYGQPLQAIPGLKTKVSSSVGVLNDFLVSNSFEPTVEPPVDLGVITLIREDVKWVDPDAVTKTTIAAEDGNTYNGFSVPAHGAQVFEIVGTGSYLVRLLTQPNDKGELVSVWIFLNEDRTWAPTEMVDFAQSMYAIWEAPRSMSYNFAGVNVPNVGVSLRPEVGQYLLGLTNGDLTIDQVQQILEMTIDREGAKVAVASVVAGTRGMMEAMPLNVNRPAAFMWSKQLPDGSDSLPFALAFISYDMLNLA